MKRPITMLIIGADLVALVALAFLYPQWMVAPGAVKAEHAAIGTRCLACHAPWRGASAERCATCHSPSEIGLRTTLGVAIAARSGRSAIKGSFHQDLIEPDCMDCHGDHRRARLEPRSRRPFSHELLRLEVRDRCERCHQAPDNALHRGSTGSCTTCHTAERWSPARFDHDRLFQPDGDHNVACVTCHVGGDYQRYTCYGCHEHTVDTVREEHEEEGAATMADLRDCVRCHRSARKGHREGGHGGEHGE